MSELLGIVGGMGPFASAEFVRTIYEARVARVEQQLPRCVLYSDPTVPDRTSAISGGGGAELGDRLVSIMRELERLGSTKIVVCCVTSHHFFGALPPELRRKVISLVDVVVDELLRQGKRSLLLSTSGSRAAGVFTSNERWPLVEHLVALPTEEDQGAIHEMIYRLKLDPRCGAGARLLSELLPRYGTDSFIAGCTEIHLFSKQAMREGVGGRGCTVIDPLVTIAERFDEYVGA